MLCRYWHASFTRPWSSLRKTRERLEWSTVYPNPPHSNDIELIGENFVEGRGMKHSARSKDARIQRRIREGNQLKELQELVNSFVCLYMYQQTNLKDETNDVQLFSELPLSKQTLEGIALSRCKRTHRRAQNGSLHYNDRHSTKVVAPGAERKGYLRSGKDGEW